MKTADKNIKVTFLVVKDNQTKLTTICNVVSQAFKKEKKILILVPNLDAAHYIDHLLWRLPEESFIPHQIVQSTSKEWVVITTHMEQNLNQSTLLLNLGTTISPIYHQFEEIYELYDETHPQKIELSKKRLADYQAKHISVSLIS